MQTRVVADLVGEADANYLQAHFEEIDEIWNKRQIFRTETEMRVSVLNDIKFPSHAAKYWQAVREMSVFYQNMVTLSFDYRRNALNQLKTQRSIEAEQDDIEKQLLTIDLDELQFGQGNMEQTARDRMREIKIWRKIMAECVEDDPAFDTHNPNTHQLDSYLQRFKSQIENMGNASPSEKANLVGQYQTARRHVAEKSRLEKSQAEKETSQLKNGKAYARRIG